MPTSISEAIRADARALGFDVCRFARAELDPAVGAKLDRAIADGHHASMGWMQETRERRRDPRAMWDEARTAIVLGTDYTPRSDPLETARRTGHGNISVYARSRDYHDVIKGRLKTLASKIVARAGGDLKVFVDTAPLMEKPLAQAAGLGWQGKHTNLVSRTHGSWLMLGTILTTLEIEPDAAESDHCGTCRACQDACPTAAFPAPYRLDARRCISYLTIEHRGAIPREFREPMGNRIYGCDDCLAVCPWNKFAGDAADNRIAEPADWRDPPLGELLALDDAGFRKRFSGSPVKRIGRDRFVRNVLIAAGNSGDSTLGKPVLQLLKDTSPVVRGAAVWALKRLGPDVLVGAWAVQGRHETDPQVLEEWAA